MKRLLAALGVAVVLSLGVTVTLPPSVAQASISPLAPDPLNILPSVVAKGVVGGGGSIAAGNAMLLAMLQKHMKNKQFWDIVGAKSNGTATAANLVELAKEKSKFKIPAFKPSTLAKGAGTAGAVLFAFDAGFTVGEFGLSLFGIDRTGAVCEGAEVSGEWLAVVGLADCTEFKKNAEFIANQGLVPGLTGGTACRPAGAGFSAGCITLSKQGKNFEAGGDIYSTYCFTTTGNVGQSANWKLQLSNGTTLNNETPSWGQSAAGYCSLSASVTNMTVFNTGPGQRGLTAYGWNGSGTLEPVKAKDMNPLRTFKCVVLGSNGTTYTKVSAEFRESDPIIPEPECPSLPAGVFPEHVKITEEGGGEEHVIYEEDATPESKGWNATHPECADATCMLDLLKNGKSCFVTPGPCLDWFDDPQKTDNYTCKYGGKVVALSECNVYGPSFNDPKTTGHPTTGQPFGNPKPDPKDPKTFETPVQDPTKARQCFPQGWSVLNPVEWVVRPVMCALEWAFVPRPTTIASLNNGLRTNVNSSVLGNAQTFITAFAAPFQQGTGNCQGPPFKIQMDLGPKSKMNQTYYPLNSCEGVMSTLAFFSYTVSGGVIYLGAALAAIKYFASIFGFAGMAGRALDSSGSSSKVQFKAT